MSHMTLEDSPGSSTDSLRRPRQHVPPQVGSVGPDPTLDQGVADKRNKPHNTGVEPHSYWDPYTPTPGGHHEEGDSIPLVALERHYDQVAGSSPDYLGQPQQPWWKRFEPVPKIPIILHMAYCFASYPIVYFISTAASGLSLFWTRLIVGGVCGVVGLGLGVSLVDLSRRSIEAALWAVIIHESMRGEIDEDLNYHTANPLSPWAAVLLLYKKFLGKVLSRNKKAIRNDDSDRTPWWLCIVLFLITATIAASLAFVLGRIVDISATQQMQTTEYSEISIAGDVTPAEIARAASQVEEIFSQVAYTWTITPLSSAAHVPTDRYFTLNRTSNANGAFTIFMDTIHFSETSTSQLAPADKQPAGFGTFLNQSQVGGMSVADVEDMSADKIGAGPRRAFGQIVRWPRWGSRIKCQLIEDLERYLTPHSTHKNMTYLYVPWTAVNSIFDAMGLPAPNASVFPPVNFTAFMEGDDTPDVNVTPSEIAITSKWWDNGVSHSFDYEPVSRGEDGNGWLTVELVMVRLNESYTPQNSSFQVYGELGSAENRTRIGFDAAICLEEVKGYVLDAYNSSAGSPVTLNLQYNGTQLNNSAKLLTQDRSKSEELHKLAGPPLPANVQHGISSAGKWAVYNASHYNARNIMLKDNGRDWWFAPNPTVVVFGGGMAPTEYTKLNPANVARVLSNSDSQHLLPYLVGTQQVVAYVFDDKAVACTVIYTRWLAVTLTVVLIAGVVVTIFVPRLPLGVSRRDIGVTSWLAAIEDDPSAKAYLSPIVGERFERLQRRATAWGNNRRNP